MQNTWVSRIGIVALFGGLWLVNHGLEITPATAPAPVDPADRFVRMIIGQGGQHHDDESSFSFTCTVETASGPTTL